MIHLFHFLTAEPISVLRYEQVPTFLLFIRDGYVTSLNDASFMVWIKNQPFSLWENDDNDDLVGIHQEICVLYIIMTTNHWPAKNNNLKKNLKFISWASVLYPVLSISAVDNPVMISYSGDFS